MDFDGFVRHLSTIDMSIIDPIADQCNKMNWLQVEYSRHEPPLKEGKLVVFPFPIKPRDYHLTDDQRALLELCKPACDRVMSLYPGHVFLRGEVATLMPGVQLGWHRDPAWFHEHCIRIHVPVKTNDACVQLWNEFSQHVEPGNIYEINNRARHSAVNGGDEIRTHLILDICDRSTWEDFMKRGGNPVALTCDPDL
jgi:hypothetical protein